MARIRHAHENDITHFYMLTIDKVTCRGSMQACVRPAPSGSFLRATVPACLPACQPERWRTHRTVREASGRRREHRRGGSDAPPPLLSVVCVGRCVSEARLVNSLEHWLVGRAAFSEGRWVRRRTYVWEQRRWFGTPLGLCVTCDGEGPFPGRLPLEEANFRFFLPSSLLGAGRDLIFLVIKP